MAIVRWGCNLAVKAQVTVRTLVKLRLSLVRHPENYWLEESHYRYGITAYMYRAVI